MAGYLCGNHTPSSVAAICSGAGIQAQVLPNIQSNLGQATQGYQLFATPNGAANIAASIISTGAYDAFTLPAGPNAGNVVMAGTCFTTGACGVGNGGMDHNARIPYAQQASAEIDRQVGKGFSVSVTYLFVGARKLVRGNNLNIPCPAGTTKSAVTDPLPEWVPGLLDANGGSTPCTGTPTLGTGALAGLGPWFGGALGSGLQTISAGLINYNNDVANATYHGLPQSVRKAVVAALGNPKRN